MERRLHKDEIPIDDALVRRLVRESFPQYADLSVRRLQATGSTNALYRLGEDLLVRLPRQPGGGTSIYKEEFWVPQISPFLPVTVPEIVGVGEPGFGYGERWSITRWVPGKLPDACGPEEVFDESRLVLAQDLADFILALRAVPVSEVAASDPALRWYRGLALTEFDRPTRRNIERCRSIEGCDLDLDAVLTFWETSLKTDGADQAEPDCWYHSDLVAENLLLANDRLTAVLDFGGLAVGDPTIDLHGAWEVLDAPALEVFRTTMKVDDAQWIRGAAWAVGIALGCFTYYWDTMPGRRSDRMAMIRSVLAEFGG